MPVIPFIPSTHPLNTSFKTHKHYLQMFWKACHPTRAFKTLVKNPKRQLWEQTVPRVQLMLILIPTEEQTMRMRNAVTIPSSYPNVLCGIRSQNKLQRASDTLVGCLCSRNIQVVTWWYPYMENALLKQILWQQSTLWKQVLWQLRFPTHWGLYWKIPELIYWGNLNYMEYFGHTEKKGKHLCAPHWHFGISQVTTTGRREADRPLGASGGNCSSHTLTSLLQQFFPNIVEWRSRFYRADLPHFVNHQPARSSYSNINKRRSCREDKTKDLFQEVFPSSTSSSYS